MTLRPNEFEVGKDGDRVTLTFRADTGESQAVSLARAQVATFVARISQEIGAGSVVPIDRGTLQIGASFSVQGWQIQKRDDGARRIVLAIDLPDQDRVVTMPLDFTSAEVAQFIEELK